MPCKYTCALFAKSGDLHQLVVEPFQPGEIATSGSCVAKADNAVRVEKRLASPIKPTALIATLPINRRRQIYASATDH